MLLNSMAELARHMGLSSTAIQKARKAGKLRLTDSGKIDTTDPVNFAYIQGASKKAAAQRKTNNEFYNDAESNELEAEKLRADIEWKKRQSRKLDLEHAIKLQSLIPTDQMRLWMGAFVSGIQNNFLLLGNRVARGDKTLRNKIEKEVTKSIEKTLKNAGAQLREYSERKIELLKISEEDYEDFEKEIAGTQKKNPKNAGPKKST